VIKRTLLAAFALALATTVAFAQSAPLKILSATGTNSNLIHAGQTLLKALLVVNTTSTEYYLKLYDKATAPTCGTDTPLWTVPIPSTSTDQPPVVLGSSDGLMFPLGLGLCITGAIAETTPPRRRPAWPSTSG
jgi:hypothetical protein